MSSKSLPRSRVLFEGVKGADRNGCSASACQFLGAHVPLSAGKHRGVACVALQLLLPKPRPGASDSAFDSFPAFGFKLFIHDKYHTDPYLMS